MAGRQEGRQEGRKEGRKMRKSVQTGKEVKLCPFAHDKIPKDCTKTGTTKK